MKVFFCRHGETEFNKEKRLMGCLVDSPLTELGKEQAQSLVGKLEGIDFDRVFVSSNQRAIDTIEVSGLGLNYKIDDRLREQSFGEMTGVLVEEILEEVNEAYWADRFRHRQKGGESLEDLFKGRVREFLVGLSRENIDNVLVVSHGGVMVVVDLLFGVEFEEAIAGHVGNCEIKKYDMNDLKL